MPTVPPQKNEARVLECLHLWQCEGVTEVNSGIPKFFKQVPTLFAVATLNGMMAQEEVEAALRTIAALGWAEPAHAWYGNQSGWRLPDSRVIRETAKEYCPEMEYRITDGTKTWFERRRYSDEYWQEQKCLPEDCNAYRLTGPGIEAARRLAQSSDQMSRNNTPPLPSLDLHEGFIFESLRQRVYDPAQPAARLGVPVNVLWESCPDDVPFLEMAVNKLIDRGLIQGGLCFGEIRFTPEGARLALERAGTQAEANTTPKATSVAGLSFTDQSVHFHGPVNTQVLQTGQMAHADIQTGQPRYVGKTVEPSHIDAFKNAIGKVGPQAVGDVKMPLAVPEDQVRATFERLLGEPFHAKDSGVECCDLFTLQATHDGKLCSLVAMFKGPGIRKWPLQMANCGKNGNQVVKLFEVPADIYLVQANGPFDATLLKHIQDTADAWAMRRRCDVPYVLIDGTTTAKILRRAGVDVL